MKKRINTINLFVLGLMVFSVICLVLRSVAMLTALDSYIGYFDRSAAITFFDRSFFATAIAFGIVTSFFAPKASVSARTPEGLWNTLASIVLGFIWAIFALLFAIIGMAEGSILVYVVAAGAIGSAVYYVYEGFRPITRVSGGRTVASLLPILSLLAIVFLENFDFTIALNSPDKQVMMFFFVLAPLYIVQKLKLATEAPSQKLYLMSAFLTIFIGIYFSIPGIIANLSGTLNESKYLVYYLLALAISAYATVDLITRIKLSSFSETSEVSDPSTEK